MNTELVVQTIATRLRTAADSGIPTGPVRNELEAGGLELAYAVQNANTEYAIAQGRRLVGRKIGLTAKSVQQQLGVDSPDFGMLFADMAVSDGDQIPLRAVLQPKVEAEVAFVLERDLTDAQATLADVISAVAYALPAIEIVGSRIANWDIKLLDTVADNASSGLFVLGSTPSKLNGLDLRLCGMVMDVRGNTASVGTGAACLGNPLNATLWLARKMAELGRPLQAGDVVMSGALGPMAAVAPGDFVEASIGGLGSVRVAFA